MTASHQRIEYRCNNKLHGIKREFPNGTFLEVLCKEKWCGSKVGEVVFHYFDLETGVLDHTKRYKDPVNLGERTARQLNSNNSRVNLKGYKR